MNFKTVLILLCVFWTSFIYAQNTPIIYKDKVILTNGSILIGRITDYNPDTHVEMELQGGSVVVFKSGQIKSIQMYESRGIKPLVSLKTSRSPAFKSSGSSEKV